MLDLKLFLGSIKSNVCSCVTALDTVSTSGLARNQYTTENRHTEWPRVIQLRSQFRWFRQLWSSVDLVYLATRPVRFATFSILWCNNTKDTGDDNKWRIHQIWLTRLGFRPVFIIRLQNTSAFFLFYKHTYILTWVTNLQCKYIILIKRFILVLKYIFKCL